MIGFVYLWMDSARHSTSHPNRRMFCLGSHCGTEGDGYKTSTGGTRFKNAHKRRPQDFKRRIIQRIYVGNSRTVLEAEQRWLDLIRVEELRHRYYNRKKAATGLSREDLLRLHEEDPTLRIRMGQATRDAHIADPNLGRRMGSAMKNAYVADPEILKRREITRKINDEANPDRKRIRSEVHKTSYENDPTLKERIGKAIRDVYATDPTFKERVIKGHQAAYAADPEIGKRHGASMSAAYDKDPTLRERVGDGSRGTRWIKNNLECRRIKLDEPIPDGWILGKLHTAQKTDPESTKRKGEARSALYAANPELLILVGSAGRGKFWINNGVKRRRIKPDDPLPEGWIYGYKLKDPTQ